MTKASVIAAFREAFPAKTFHRRDRRGRVHVDTVMRAEAWNNYTDMLARDGMISAAQYHNWTNPF